VEDLAELEGDPARGAALRALGRLNAPGAGPHLAAIAQNEDEAPDLRMDAVEGLAELGSLAPIEALAGRDDELGALCRELLAEARAETAKAERADSAKTERPDAAKTDDPKTDQPGGAKT
jgi:HEAT repeat protein